MRRHDTLRTSARGLLLLAFLWLALVACNNCSPKMKPAEAPPDLVEMTEEERLAEAQRIAEERRREEEREYRERIPVESRPAERPGGRPVEETVGDVPGGDMGDMDDDYYEDNEPVTTSSGHTTSRPSQAQDFDPFAEDDEEEPSKPALNADDYKVALDVTNEITLNSTATLRVWIGLENYIPKAIPTTVRDTTTIPANLGDYARITPYAPDFTVGPEESQVMRIVPSGSSVLFSLTPQKEGEFLISARIELYDNPDLVGVAIPKTSDIVSVVVKVDTIGAVKGGLSELGAITWKELKKFWAAIMVVFFGALLFLFRKFVHKKTGFISNGTEGSDYETGESYTPTETEEPEYSGSGDGDGGDGGGGDMEEDPFPSADEDELPL